MEANTVIERAEAVRGGALYRGLAFRNRRVEMDLRIGDLAGALGVSVAQLSRLERNKSNPPFSTVAALAYVLQLDMADVVQYP